MNKNTPQTPLTAEIVAKIRTAVEDSDMSYRVLEEKSGVSKTKIHAILNNERDIRLPDLIALCEAVGLVPWKVLKEATAKLSAATPTLKGPEEYGLAAHTGEREIDQ